MFAVGLRQQLTSEHLRFFEKNVSFPFWLMKFMSLIIVQNLSSNLDPYLINL